MSASSSPTNCEASAADFRGKPMFSRTTDGGESWSRPISMTGNQNVYAPGNQIAVLPDGTLVNVFAILFKGSGIQPPQANQVFMAVTRSTDGGRSWQAPNARGFFLGDYMGLEAIGDDLLAFFATTQGDSANVYSARANR